MKKIIFIALIFLELGNSLSAQTHKRHIRHRITGTLKGAKYGGPIGAAGGFVVGRHFDKKKERKEERKAADTTK